MWADISLIAIVGRIHLIEATEHFEEATYLGLLFLANAVGSLVTAIGIYRGYGQSLGVLDAGGTFVEYAFSRTTALPGLPVEE